MKQTPADTSLVQSMKGFEKSFWLANVIELFERWSYYGVRGGVGIYIVTAAALGGLEFTHIQKASIFLWWAAAQAFLPTFTGGLADRFGRKKMVFIAITISIIGYLFMAFQKEYTLFFTACMFVAIGTALFKPGIQSIIATSTTEQNRTIGWSFFYMIVNVGGFTGPLLAGYLRLFDWQWVFLTSALMQSLNYLILLTIKEKPSEALPPQENLFISIIKTIGRAFRDILEPRLMLFLIVFSGFWLTFMQLFDLLPNYITDWVDTAPLAQMLWNDPSRAIPAEWLINLDAFAIIILMMPIGRISSKFHPVPSMILGIFLSTMALMLAGYTMNIWWCALGIFLFAIGEMIAAPRKNEYLSMIAPPGKIGLYMGYLNFPVGIGWMLGSKIAGPLYQNHGDKINLAKDYMVTNLHMARDVVETMPREKVLESLQVALGHASQTETTKFLFQVYHPEKIWLIFGIIGLCSMFGMMLYAYVVKKSRKKTVTEDSYAHTSS